MATSSLYQLCGGPGFQPATVKNPRAVGQGMLGFNLPAFDGQAEGDSTHAQASRRFGETQPAFGLALFLAVTRDPVVTAPAIVSSEQIRARTRTASTISFAVWARLCPRRR